MARVLPYSGNYHDDAVFYEDLGRRKGVSAAEKAPVIEVESDSDKEPSKVSKPSITRTMVVSRGPLTSMRGSLLTQAEQEESTMWRRSRYFRPGAPPAEALRTRPLRNLACDQCGTVFSRQSLLDKHMIKHSELRPYPCGFPGCTLAFKRAAHLKRHQMWHDERFHFKCPWKGCTKLYLDKSHLDTHYAKHTKKIEWHKCTWKGCKKKFDKLSSLREHLCTHTGNRAYECEYPDCHYQTNHPANITQHVKHVHEKTFDHHCIEPGCGESFFTFPMLRKHIESFHPTTMKCPVCERQVDAHTSQSFRRHLKKHTLKKSVFRCDECHKEYTTLGNLRQHKDALHNGLKTFPCMVEPCAEVFVYKSCLQRHLKKVHGKSNDDIELLAPKAKRCKVDELDLVLEPSESGALVESPSSATEVCDVDEMLEESMEQSTLESMEEEIHESSAEDHEVPKPAEEAIENGNATQNEGGEPIPSTS